MTKIFNSETKVINDATAPVPVSSSAPLAMIIYESGTNMYICSAAMESVASDPVWQIKYVNSASGTVVQWCDGNALFDNVATSLAVVELLSYS